jgi:polysaccharide pyruvyl transferase WcaK-like protein
LTPLNCYDADDVRLWSQQHGIADCRFRPAIAVKRYDNADFVERYRFTPEQRFHLANFFESQARQAGLMLREKLYFKSLVDQIALERSRQATCRWQTQAVALDMSGNLRFCPVQSPVLGTVHREDPRHIYSQGASVRSHIIQKHCPTCQYDAVDLPPLNVLIGRGHAVLGQKIKRLFLSRPSPVEVGKVWPATHDAPRQWRKVLITGWYGTETTGDKAILAEVLHFLERHAPGCQVVLTTIDRKVSQQTERELNGLIGSTLVDLPHAADPALIESVDAVMVGGGPLMDTSAMEWVYRIFRQANRQRKARIIFGCGVGPLRSERMRQLTAAVLHMATAGFLRDAESHAAAAQLAPGNPLVYACDPAVGYLCRWRESHPAARPGRDIPRQIAVMLRANTGEFLTADGTQQISTANVQAARQMAQFLELACTTAQARASLLPMNCHWLGGDDRLFNRQVAGNFGDPTAVQVEKAYLPLDDVSGQVAAADVGVAMRYHGHLFCMALGIPFLSIDYTGYPGKVNSLVHRIGYQQWSEEWHTLDAKRAARRLQQLFAERTQWANFLIQQANELSASLQQTYQTLFSIQE